MVIAQEEAYIIEKKRILSKLVLDVRDQLYGSFSKSYYFPHSAENEFQLEYNLSKDKTSEVLDFGKVSFSFKDEIRGDPDSKDKILVAIQSYRDIAKVREKLERLSFNVLIGDSKKFKGRILKRNDYEKLKNSILVFLINWLKKLQ